MSESESQIPVNDEPQGEQAKAAGETVPPGTSVPPARAGGEADEVQFVDEDEEISALRAELERVRAEAQKTRDQLLRTAADFDNYRKRARKDVEDALRKGTETALLEMLPVSDNLERAMSASAHATDVAPILEGVQMVLRFFTDALGRLGVERVQALGVPFDPAVHEAVAQVETTETPPGSIVSEMIPGYRLGPKLLRAAMVSVARAPVSSSPPSPSQAPGTPSRAPLGASQAPGAPSRAPLGASQAPGAPSQAPSDGASDSPEEREG